MDALNDKTYTVYFGGSYEERWSSDYKLTVDYHDRTPFTGRRLNGKWTSDPPVPDLPLATEYFETSCEVQWALDACRSTGFGVSRLYEVWSGKSVLAPFELFRALLDDEGLEFENALALVIRCCPNIDFVIDCLELCKLNPRTSHLVEILKTALSVRMAAVHDCRLPEYRSPVGAVKAGDCVRLSVYDVSGTISTAQCVLYGPDGEKAYGMSRDGDHFLVDITSCAPAALRYRFKLISSAGEKWLCPDLSGFFGLVCDTPCEGFRLTVYREDFRTPDWFKKSVMYQIFPDRFAFSDDGTAEKGIEYHRSLGQTPELHNSLDETPRYLPRPFERDYEPDDFYGGTLKGITKKLPYLKALGITVIYLNPIVEARSNHRYDTSDYMKVDPILGTDEDFSRLCEAADGLGIRVITDGVFSHTGADSSYFDFYGHYGGSGACHGDTSPYYDWYSFSEFPEKYRCWWNFPDLPEVDERNPNWQNFVVTGTDSVVKTWLRRGAAGWRLDVADELPDEVLALIRASAKEEKPDAVILGEVWEDAVLKWGGEGPRNYALGYSLDSVMNYPLRTAVLDFLHNRIDACALRDFLEAQKLNYPKPLYYSLMNLMGSHDVERLLTNLSTDIDVKALPRDEQAAFSVSGQELKNAEALERLAAAIQFSLPGVPSIYYGDECGMTGARDPFNRLPFREVRPELRKYYAKLSEARSSSSIMSTGFAEFTALTPDLLRIRRYGENAEVITLVNPSDKSIMVFTGKCGVNLITGDNVPARFEIPPCTELIIKTL